MTELFRAEQVSCRRGGRLVFTGLDFTVAPGAALILHGPNGSGKSSLLRLLAGLASPESGAIYRGAQAIADDMDAHKADSRYLGHATALKPMLSLHDNLLLWARLYGAPAPGEAVMTALAALRLDGHGEFSARVLSSGQARRAALARLLLSPVRLWLLDEPTVGLDTRSRADLERIMADHLAAGGQLVVATHQDIGLSQAPILNLADFTPKFRDEELL